MKYLPSSLHNTFSEVLKNRMIQDEDYSLISLVGALKWFGRLFFGSVYVNDTDPNVVTLIVAVGKKPTVENIEAAVADPDYLCEQWKYSADESSVKYNNDILFVWVDKKCECDWTAAELIIKRSSTFRIKAMRETLLESFRQTFHQFHCKSFVRADPCILHGNNIFHFPCPDGYVIRKLNVEETDVAMKSYKFASELRNQLVMATCQGFAVGAYHTSSNTLAACVFLNWDGSISALQTFEGHRRKGLAKTIVSHLGKMLFEEEAPVFCYVEKEISSEMRDMNLALYGKLAFESQTDTIVAWASMSLCDST